MKYIFVILFLLLVMFENQAEDTYLLKEEYVTPKLEMGYNRAISSELGVAYTSRYNSETASYVIVIYYSENNGDYMFQGEFQLPDTVDRGRILIADNYLIILDDTLVSFFNIGSKGELTFQKSQSVSDQLPAGKNLNGQIFNAGQSRYILKQNDYMHLVEINTTNQTVNILATLDYLQADENVVSTVSRVQYQADNNILWLVKNTNALYRFEQLDLSNQTLNVLKQFSYTFGSDFDYINEGGQIYAHHDALSNAVFVQTNRRSFIFQLNEIDQSVTLKLNQLSGNDVFLTGSQVTDEQLITREGLLYLVDVDWTNSQLLYSNTQISTTYWEYDFVSEAMILGQNTIDGGAGFYNLQNSILTNTGQKLNSELGDALPKRLLASQYDHQADRIILIGSESLTSTIPKLYIWQYNESINSADFIANAVVITTDLQPSYYNYEIIGANADYFYVYTKSNLTLQSQVRVFHLINNELQLIQSYDLGGNAEFSANDHVFVADNKIAFFPYIRSNNSYYTRLCDVVENGFISGCSDQSLFGERLFQVSSSDFQLTQLADSQYLIFGPRQNILKMTEQDISTWLLKYNSDTEMLETVQTLGNPSDETWFHQLNSAFTYNNGQVLLLNYEQAYFYQWNQNSTNWESIENISTSRYPSAPMQTAEMNYFINEDGRPYLLDINTHQFYRGDQDVNLGNSNSTYQIAEGNNGYVLDIGATSRLMTFELMNTTPFHYKGDMSIGDIDAVQDIQFDIDIGQYFLNFTDSSIEFYIDGLTFEELQHPRISWDGVILSGTLNNEDMFTSETSSQIADDFYVGIKYQNSIVDSFRITPINVNDAPVLTQAIGTQNFEPGQAYEGSFGGLVVDPDREYVSFSYENMPVGMTGTDDGTIQGSIASEGNYTIRVTASDPNGATLVFDIIIIVKKVAPSTIPSSGGGGGGTFGWFGVLLLLAYGRAKKHRY